MTFGAIENELDRTLRDYYLERVRRHMDDSYLGVRMRKFPEDLRTLEAIMWEERVDLVLEIGLGHGGSALWLRDRLETAARYGRVDAVRVISVDVSVAMGRANIAAVDPDYARTITLLESDVRDARIGTRVREHVPTGSRVLVIEDSAHLYDTTMASLRQFSGLVPPGGYFLVEDAHRDYPGMLPAEVPDFAHGVRRATDEWLAGEGAGQFVRRRDQERYVTTSNPGGWLRRLP